MIFKLTYRLLFILIAGLMPFFSIASSEVADRVVREITSNTDRACIRLESPSGKVIIGHNSTKTFIPASLIKVPLMLAAYDKLGTDYKFSTEFLINGKKDLLILGNGDPFMVSEELERIAQVFKAGGYREFGNIFIDTSRFNNTVPGYYKDSLNPYDAVPGAFVINFNTVNIRKDNRGRIFSAEEQTPLTGYVKKNMGSLLKPGQESRFNIGSDERKNLIHYKELIREIFIRQGVNFSYSNSGNDYNPAEFNKFYTHYNSKDIVEIGKGLMRYSNNFIANQILMILGISDEGYPAKFSKGRNAFNKIIDEILPGKSGQYTFAEGSGLSRDNRTRCSFMSDLLREFQQYSYTMPQKSLSYYKTGTLNGIRNIAGYIKTDSGLYRFVLMMETYKSDERFRYVEMLENVALYHLKMTR